MDKLNILFLYSEFMPYNLTVWRAVQHSGFFQVHVMHWDHKKLTPYQYTGTDLIFYKRSEFNAQQLLSLARSLRPVAVFVSGRMDLVYLSVARALRKSGLPIVMGSDKQWKGTIRDWISVVLRRWLYMRYFTHAWVPGDRQREFVQKTGFAKEKIITGLYIGNTDLFASMGNLTISQRDDILFVGRLEATKGVIHLVNVLRELRDQGIFTGKLWVFGNGSLRTVMPVEDWIIYNGFASQEQMAKAIKASSIFCLPSLDEPWGVVVHELSAAGLLLCCSDAVGAGDHFVQDGKNGLIFQAGNWVALKKALAEMIQWPEPKKEQGSQLSRLLSHTMNAKESARFFLTKTGLL